MSDIRDWSPIADNNDAPSPDGYPEGIKAGLLNNSDRETQAAVRRHYEQPTWRDLGDSITFVDNTTARLSGDMTFFYRVFQRVSSTQDDATQVYGTLTNVNYDTTDTTLTIEWDSAEWESGFQYFVVGPVPTGKPIHHQAIYNFESQLLLAQGQAGDMFPWAGSDVRIGNDALVCNGAGYDTSAYPELFAAIGYAHGGAGATFNVPNARGAVLAGRDGGQGRLTSQYLGADPDQRGAFGGSESVSVEVANMPPHSHRIEDVHQVEGGRESGPKPGSTDDNNQDRGDFITTTEGGGDPISVVQPTLIIEWYIKTGKLP